jgi:hypothetical protein
MVRRHDGRATAEELRDPFTFGAAVGRALARLDAEDRAPGSLTLPLGLSLWMRRGRLDIDQAVDALLDLRQSLVQAAGLDPTEEPVPLLFGDPRTSLLSLARYLDDLVARAAHAAATTRSEVVEQALRRTELVRS